MVQRFCVGWLSDGYMFSVESSSPMWHIPLLFKLLGKDSPFILKIHQLSQIRRTPDPCRYDCLTHVSHHMGRVARKPVFEVSDKTRPKPACLATETS